MFTWIASFFRPAEPAKVQDIESGFQPRTRPTIVKVSNKKPAPPVGGRTFNFFFNLFTHSSTSSWWSGVKSAAYTGTSYLTSSLPTFALPTATTTAPSTKPQPPSEMMELPLRAPPTIQAPRPVQARENPTKIETKDLVRSPTPLPTPPITPLPAGPYYTITDFITYSPYKLRVNPFYQPVAALSEQWLDDHQVHPSARKRAAFEACNFGLLTAMCYPDADYERFRELWLTFLASIVLTFSLLGVLCDYINCLFAFDGELSILVVVNLG